MRCCGKVDKRFGESTCGGGRFVEMLEQRHLLSAPAVPEIAVLDSDPCTISYTNTDGSRLILEQKGPGDASYYRIMNLDSAQGDHQATVPGLLPGKSYTLRVRADRDGQVQYASTQVAIPDSTAPYGTQSLSAPSLGAHSPELELNPDVATVPMGVSCPAGSHVWITSRWTDRPDFAGGPMWGYAGPAAAPLLGMADEGDVTFSGNAGWSYEFHAYSISNTDSTQVSGWSGTYTVGATGGSAESAPTGVQATRTSGNSVRLSWGAPPPGQYSNWAYVAGNNRESRESRVMYMPYTDLTNLAAGRWGFTVYNGPSGGMSSGVAASSIDVVAPSSGFSTVLAAKNQLRLIWDDTNPVETGVQAGASRAGRRELDVVDHPCGRCRDVP